MGRSMTVLKIKPCPATFIGMMLRYKFLTRGAIQNYSAYRSAIRAFPPPEAVLRWISQGSIRLAGQREASLRKQAGRPEQGGIYPFLLPLGNGCRAAAECCLYFSGNSSSCREMWRVLSLAYASYRFARYVV